MFESLGGWIADAFWRVFGIWIGGTPEPKDSVTLKVLVLNFDPIVHSEGDRPLHEVLRWNDPRTLTDEYIADLEECSGGYVHHEIVKWRDIDAYPLKEDGFRYTEEEYLRCWRAREGFHEPDRVDYRAVFAEYGITERVERGEIDEVWLWAFPYSGFLESIMAGRGAYFCNAPPIEGIPTSRIFITMGFNYERGVGEMLEDFGHRTESILRHVYGSWEHEETHAWNRFTLYDKVAPGKSACGNVHFAPNSDKDYDWGNERLVWSTCDDWLNYPNLTGQRRQVNCHDWGEGGTRVHHKWWLRRLPRAGGRTGGRLNNWWAYVVDFNRFPESRR
jgi:hypothetical protein